MKTLSKVGQSPQENKPVQLAVVKQITTTEPEQLNPSIPPYWEKPLPPGLDHHLDKEEVIFYFKLCNTLIYSKMDPDSTSYDEDWPEPVYPSPRKPVWILSELIAWQDKLKAKRNANTSRGVQQ